MQSGLIFDIKRYAINDGPGIRATIFLKGCPLHCAWCHNPESISTKIQKMYNRDKCIGCKACEDACPEHACALTKEGIVTDLSLCTSCGDCAEVCPTLATEMSGRVVTVEEMVAEVEKERVFFDQSGGGVTVSGGEPLLQSDFVCALYDELGAGAIHRAVDTTGFTRTETLLEVAKRTDLFLYDLKMMDSERHKKWTGVPNEQILKNLKTLAETGADINIRIPLIKGVNADDANIEQSANFIAGLPGVRPKVNILPYHNIMAGKYLRLGEAFDSTGLEEPDEAMQERVLDQFRAVGLKAMIGG
ncbi:MULTISPECIES: glycyl-radical enzyme activating protein [Desulfosediminicola]|uniref:glycyl-radical enzyme activating protein n=1 Tax=Desulfosediminicola TaxID=2886823 RepID=UPI0010AD7EA8|nr:glycyl-radical enzyme activating protein [Desulfosediminicola ganghwensis]